MAYQITTTTTKGDLYLRTADSIDAVDQFIRSITYRGEGRLVAVSDDPITFVYSTQIECVTVAGLTRQDILDHAQKKNEEYQAHYHAELASKYANSSLTTGCLQGTNLAYPGDSALSSMVG